MKHLLLVLTGTTFYLSLSGFQCASSQMNTAQLAIKNGEFDRAGAALEEEVALRPDNAKAWYMLGVVRSEQKQHRSMKDAFIKALEHAASETGEITESETLDIRLRINNSWGDLWGSARQLIYTSEDYDKAIAILDDAEYVMPGMPIILDMKADAYLGKKDREEANSNYIDYVELVRSDIEKGVNKGLYLGMGREQVLSTLGTPDAPFDPDRFFYADQYKTSGLSVYYISGESADKPSEVKGWKYYDYSQPEVFPYVDYWFSGYPLFNVALNDYVAGNYDDALELLLLTEKVAPTLEEVSSLMSKIYLATNRMEEAKALLLRKIGEKPRNTKNRITYAILLHNEDNYSEAISVLDGALEYERDESSEEYQDIIFNLGAFSKNWGVQLEREVANRSSVTDKQRDEYEAKYRDALKYFSRLRSVRGNTEEYELLTEIGNLHALLGDAEGLRNTIKKFEKLQSNQTIAGEAKFWAVLGDFYSYIGNEKKAKEAETKAEGLR